MSPNIENYFLCTYCMLELCDSAVRQQQCKVHKALLESKYKQQYLLLKLWLMNNHTFRQMQDL